MTERRIQVPVSLRGNARDRQYFFAQLGVLIDDGAPKPIEHEGRRYVFSHTLTTRGYGRDPEEKIYVFRETDAGNRAAESAAPDRNQWIH